MNLSIRLGHKHLQQTTGIFALSALIAVSSVPQDALAFESRLAVASAPQFIAPVRLSDRDPYLAFAADETPHYTFSDTAGLMSPLDPQTKAGNWPEEKPKNTTRLASAAPRAPKAPKRLESPLTLEGEASYYSRAGCLGCNPLRIMANGQPLQDDALTMAIGADKKHLVGHKAKVTNLATGKSVEVRITDTGGFYQEKYGNRVADLTIGTKQAIGMAGGVGQVKVEVY